MDIEQVKCTSDCLEIGQSINRPISLSSEQTKSIFYSWAPYPYSVDLDTLTISKVGMFAHAFPLLFLIPRVIQYMKQFQCTIILIAPKWPRRYWHPELLHMSVAQYKSEVYKICKANPIKIFHPNPQVFKLTAWLLSTDISRQRIFKTGKGIV